MALAFPNSPNPWKVAIILEELGLEYNIVRLGLFELKQKPYTDLNPNGRTPCLVDHDNNDFHLWEASWPALRSTSNMPD
jgi:glutathione S-transferase